MFQACCNYRVLDPVPLNPGAKRMPSAHLKQPRRPKPKLDDTVAANTGSASASAHGTSTTDHAASKQGRGRKRKLAESGEASTVSTSPDAPDRAAKPPASKATKRRGKDAAVKGEGAALDCNSRKGTAQQGQGQPAAKGSKGRKKGAKEHDEADLQLQDDVAAACAASLADTPYSDNSAQPADKAKRVGDIEFENQLAMAMASTAAEAQHKADRKPTAKVVHNEPMPSAFSPPRSGNVKPTLGETWARDARLANQDLALSDAASYWAEVFCGSADLGKWVHVDPLLNWLDVPDKVEGAGIR